MTAVGSREERLAKNEAFFRIVNERIRESVGDRGSDGHPYEFVCECSDARCVERVRLTIAEYEEIRADGSRFVLAPGHEIERIEDVVAQSVRRTVVEKRGAAGETAETLDPRAE